MGFFIKKSKNDFDELIGTNSFDDVFKNSFRDYYTYGFKSYEQLLKGRQVIDDRWKVFGRILGSRWYLDKRKNGRHQITLKTMGSDSENPFTDFFYLHKLSKIGDYLNYIIDLDARSSIYGNLDALPVNLNELQSVEGENGINELIVMNEVEHAIIINWIMMLEGNVYEEKPVRINRQLNIWSYSTRGKRSSYKDKYDSLSERTKELYSLGIIGDLRDTVEERNKWLGSQWNQYASRLNSSPKRLFNHQTYGEHFWFKSTLTMSYICEMCQLEQGDTQENFLRIFKTMCDFFSQYYPLGEIGTLLSKRCDKKIGQNTVSAFKFKHNYIQKILYDYNLIDLLVAIENSCFCLVSYSHGLNLHSFEELIYPLEIRISVVDGREYVLYYHIEKRRIMALRLEFIDKILVYYRLSSVKRVKKSVRKSGRKLVKEEIDSQNVVIDKEDFSQQIKIAKEMLPFIWGTDTEYCNVEGSWEENLIPIELSVEYDPQSEEYISRRLKKECRFEKPDNKVLVFPTKELRKWIRSFYMRIANISDLNIGGFSVVDDIEAMWNVYNGEHILQGDGGNEYRKTTEKEYIEETYTVEGDCMPANEGHAALFHELFSKYSVVIADSVLECSGNRSLQLDKVLLQNIKSTFDYYNNVELEKVTDILINNINASELIDDKGTPRFKITNADYLYDTLPLTKMEVKWLLTVLEDPLVELFINKKQIQTVLNVLYMAPFKAKKFNLEVINYYDRYNIEDRMLLGSKTISQDGRVNKKELYHLQVIRRSIENGIKLKINYKNWKGKKIWVLCSPVWIEYSRRDDIFRLSYIHSNRKRIMKINIPRIIRVIECESMTFNLTEERSLFNKILEQSAKSIIVEFYQGERNLLDRILTEFSLWKKKCVYDVATGLYSMRIYYSIYDEKEVLLRLLSYGPYIRVIAEEENYILNQIKDRIIRQRDLIHKVGKNV